MEIEHSNRCIAFVVDDEELIASTLEQILSNKGIDARSFVDPLDALKAANSVAPNLLLTDVMMPKMDGIELANQITQLHPDCKVLLSSGYFMTTEELGKPGSHGQQFAILPKPVRSDSLFAKIKELLAERVAPACQDDCRVAV